MELLDLEKLRVFLVFAVPGIVILYMRAQFLTGRIPALAEGIVAYITVSLVYYALALPLMSHVQAASGFAQSLLWIFVVIVGPALVGAALGLNVRKGWLQWLLAKFGISTVHPVNSAWDWRFAGTKSSWVLAILKDGSRWAGYLGGGSFLSSDPAERDLFIQRVYELDESNNWLARESGVWIAHGEIQSLELWPDKPNIEEPS
ncbi:DUF6338 family protein [Novosphingobium sp. PASSN1]|uniref:DUF6338 family protein n=1 Tax=Novosphingobium sp. PASSN1 TaxID=2015561 RepID=UPI000BD4A0F2|nr:DUF6338 family protein [Novosphingobium sp. PASSN1]OYU34367.1 MAG: hypothetical protein CFE35_15390 [Novosphingobium sp. PASSN1]